MKLLFCYAIRESKTSLTRDGTPKVHPREVIDAFPWEEDSRSKPVVDKHTYLTPHGGNTQISGVREVAQTRSRLPWGHRQGQRHREEAKPPGRAAAIASQAH